MTVERVPQIEHNGEESEMSTRDKVMSLVRGVELALAATPIFHQASAEQNGARQMIEFPGVSDATWRVSASRERILLMKSSNDTTQVADISLSPASENSAQDTSNFTYTEYLPAVSIPRRNNGIRLVAPDPIQHTNTLQASEGIFQMIRELQKLRPHER